MDDTREIVPRWTPGRWYADSERPDWKLNSICVYVDIEREDPTIVAEVSNNGELEGHGEGNAKLISSAPDFAAACTPERLEALQTVIYQRDVYGPDSGSTDEVRALLTDLRAAMDKATGGKP